MINKVELLAPAGDFDSLRAAVENGADAVYLGGKLFNARQFAGNFDLQKLGEALNYAHVRGVNIYLAMNTLISDSEMKEAAEFAGEAYLAGIDGIIVQDLGFAGIINKMMPDLPLHASTQMIVHSLEGAKVLERAGFKRVVLARELALDEIMKISVGTSLEVEVFIHGALCICYSGQCLMSSIIGGRSGNRGKCAQPCRLPYTLMEGKSASSDKIGSSPQYLLSPKDLCTLPQLAEIAMSGVKSLKIEGRMKSPEYVATVVRIYRKYLDLIADPNRQLSRIYPESIDMYCNKSESQDQSVKDEKPSPDTVALTPEALDLHQLAQVFNRGGFTGGYVSGNTGQHLMCYEKPKNWGTFLGQVISFNPQDEIVQVKLGGNVAIGDGIEVWNDEDQNPGTIVTLIRINGKNVKEACKSDIAGIGNIRGKIFKGCKVYKTSDKRLLDAARESFEGRFRKRVGLKGEAILKKDMPLILKVYDEDGNEAAAKGSVLPEKALNRSLTRERLAEQLKKTGATPFEFEDLVIQLEEGLSLPVSEINDIRRKALDQLEQKRVRRYSRSRVSNIADIGDMLALPRIQQNHPCVGVIGQQNRSCVSTSEGKQQNRPCVSCEGRIAALSGRMPRIALYFYEWNSGMDYESLGADRLYIPFKALLKQENADRLSALREKGTEVFIWTPSIIRGNYLRLIKDKIKNLFSLNIDGILAGNPGIVELLDKKISTTDCHVEAKGDNNPVPLTTPLTTHIRLAGDYSFNVFNTNAALMYKSIGFEGITLSAELNLGQISEISRKADMDIESVVYGRLPLMVSEYCPVGSVKGGYSSHKKCSGCCNKSEYRLRDRLGIEFPVICDKIDCRSTILNSNVLFVPDAIGKLAAAGISALRFYIWDESSEQIRGLVSLHRELAKGADTQKDAALIDQIKSAGFTKGHFYKGV